MRGNGITYDTGFINQGVSTRVRFDPEVLRREMRIIHDDLHCNAVRITGGDAGRLEVAAGHAAQAGLEVWLSPFTCDLTAGEMLDLLADCAECAERLRRGGAEVVLLTGSELSLFDIGFLPGDSLRERLDLLFGPERPTQALSELPARINEFLARAVALVRERFGGRISYASLPLEGVDWTPFDFVSTDAGYRSAEVAGRFRDGIRGLVAQGKPVAITEFGCTTHRGAADRGGRGGMIVEWDGAVPVRLDGDYTRDEDEQAGYLRELLEIFDAEGVDSAFVNTFASYHLPHRDDPREDLDMASYGLVTVLEDRLGRTYPNLPWEPKAAFAALADLYGR
jgi:hypothetical protein